MTLAQKKMLANHSISVDDTYETKIELKGFNNVKAFIDKEIEGWGEVKNRDRYLDSMVANYVQLQSYTSSIQNKIDNKTFDEIEHLLNNLTFSYRNIFFNLAQPMIFSSSPLGQYLIKIYKENQNQGIGALHFLRRTNWDRTQNEYFLGALKIYSFLYHSKSKIFHIEEFENESFSSLRNQWSQVVQDTTEDFNQTVSKHEKFLEDAEEQIQEYKTNTMKLLDDITKSYRDKLALEGPVTYWKERAEKYRSQGIIWSSLLTISILLIGSLLFSVLYNLPDSFHHNLFNANPTAIKGFLLLATIISFFAYLSRVLSKLTFSSFHLQRDAEEREQLTKVYLALIKEKAIKEEDRSLILQSLFSRSDTGLLSGDSSPTMPGLAGLTETIFKNK